MPLGQETTYETSCQEITFSENIIETSIYRNVDLSSSASIVTSISDQLTQWIRIELIIHFWARRYRSYLRDGRVGSFILPVNPFTMDVHSSSLLSSTAPAPDQLAEERSALSQVYSDTLSSDPESSPQPLPSPHQTSQDATDESTVESILIAQIVDNLKNL